MRGSMDSIGRIYVGALPYVAGGCVIGSFLRYRTMPSEFDFLSAGTASALITIGWPGILLPFLYLEAHSFLTGARYSIRLKIKHTTTEEVKKD